MMSGSRRSASATPTRYRSGARTSTRGRGGTRARLRRALPADLALLPRLLRGGLPCTLLRDMQLVLTRALERRAAAFPARARHVLVRSRHGEASSTRRRVCPARRRRRRAGLGRRQPHAAVRGGYAGTYGYACIAIPPVKYEAHGIQTLKGTDQESCSLRYTWNVPPACGHRIRLTCAPRERPGRSRRAGAPRVAVDLDESTRPGVARRGAGSPAARVRTTQVSAHRPARARSRPRTRSAPVSSRSRALRSPRSRRASRRLRGTSGRGGSAPSPRRPQARSAPTAGM